MFRFLVIALVTFFLSVATVKKCLAQQSPCPQYFNYQHDGTQYYGSIEVPPPQSGSSLTIQIQMSIKAALPDYNKPGTLQLEKSKEEANEDVAAGRNLRYRVYFPLLTPLPVLTALNYNGRLICSGRGETIGPGEQMSNIELHHTLRTTIPMYQGYMRPQSVPQQIPQQVPQQIPQQVPQQIPQQVSQQIPQQVSQVSQPQPSQNSKQKPSSNAQSSKYPAGSSSVQETTYQWIPPSESNNNQGYYALVSSTQPLSSPQTNTQQQPAMPESAQDILTDIFEATPNKAVAKPVRPTTTRPPTIAPNFWVTEPSSTAQAVQPVSNAVIDNVQHYNSNECGKPLPSLNNLAIGGTQTKRGEWPWIVAIYKQKIRASSLQLDYYCSGTLISRDIVVSAAHCIRTSTGKIVSMDEIQIHIGQNDLADLSEPGIIIQRPRHIEPHPDYRIWDTSSSSADGDIAIIRLRETVKFTQYIRPACLWEGSKNVKEIVNQPGVVVGWGRDQTGEVTNVPNKVFLAPVPEDVCRRSNEAFQYILSPRTFCAGNRDGVGPCNGDSGAGWVLKRSDGRWYLRGVVSSSLPDPDRNNLCDLKNYVVFSDTAKYYDWIKSFIT